MKNPLRVAFLSALIPFLCSSGNAAQVASVTKETNGISINLSSGKLELRPINDDAILVRFSDGKTPEMKSFVLGGEITTPNFSLQHTPTTVTLTAPRMKALFDLSNGSLRFEDLAGNVFLEEKQGTRELKPRQLQGQQSWTVGQEFLSPGDEKLFGLGQFQDGLWNWRGIPLELRQLNTQIAMPVLISNKGYGLLWENPSRTDFNDPGTAIPLTLEGKQTKTGSAPTATEQLPQAKVSSSESVGHGSYTTKDAGEYVFSIRDADRRNHVAIRVNGKEIAGVSNMWTPRSAVGSVTLPAQITCTVTVEGGGPEVKLFARPRGDTTSFHSDYGNAIDYTVFYGPKLDQVISGLRRATGNAPLWPKWAYGLWQCRERYNTQKEMLYAATEYRKRQIPVDLFVQDWFYWINDKENNPMGRFSWDSKRYPDPEAMIRQLHEEHLKFMISVWCNATGPKMEDLVKHSIHRDIGYWIDVFDPIGRALRWKYLNQLFFSKGADAWWGDATEPGDPGTDLLGQKVFTGPGDSITSAYPLFASQSIYEGQRSTDPEKRVCTLTRSSFPGMQRYAAAAWSGDINGNWETFRRQIPAGLNFCLTGMPYWTTDCAGFFHPDNQYASADYNELLSRWFQWSTFCPILRLHGYKTKTEIWNWLPETRKILLTYDRLRYLMLPYNYTVGSEVTFHGATIMKALGMDFPNDPKVWDLKDEYLFGPSFLVAPVTTPKATSREVYLPAGTRWVNFWTGESHPGGKTLTVPAPITTIPLFVKAGSIVPLGPDLQYTSEKPADPIEIRVYPGSDGSFTLYEDEGDSYRYEKGVCSTIPFTWDNAKKTLSIGARRGEFPGMLRKRTFRVVLVAPGKGTGIDPSPTAHEITYEGTPINVTL